MKRRPRYYLLAILIGFGACTGIKPAASGGKAGKLYESFYRPDGATQYYIKPLTFSDDAHTAEVDFVYRSNFSADSLVTCNFSVTYPAIGAKLMSASFSTEDTYPLLALKKIYDERKGEELYVRYTSKMKYGAFREVIVHSQRQLSLKTERKTLELSASSKTQKRLGAVQQQLFFDR